MRELAIIGVAAVSLALTGCGDNDVEQARPEGAATAGAERTGMRSGMGPQRGRMGRRGGRGPMARGPEQQGSMAREERCPMLISEAEIRAEEIEGGVALVFTTIDASKVEELRERVRAMAAHHERMAQRGQRGGRGPMARAMSNANVVEVVGGARLELRADDPSQVASLRQHAQMRAERMSQGQCPMMEDRQATG